MNKYYYSEHENAYLRIEREGKTSWDDLRGGTGFDDFSSREHLERSLAMLRLDTAETDVLEYGCGTVPAACFLAVRGFRVDAIDLIPRADRSRPALCRSKPTFLLHNDGPARADSLIRPRSSMAHAAPSRSARPASAAPSPP